MWKSCGTVCREFQWAVETLQVAGIGRRVGKLQSQPREEPAWFLLGGFALEKLLPSASQRERPVGQS